jgi:hypothetical protein
MKTISSIILMLSCALISAQDNTPGADSIKTPWTFATAEKNLKFTPMEVLSIIPTFGADLEVNLDNKISLQAGVAAVIPTFQHLAGTENGLFNKMGGYRLRAESRFFVFKKTGHYLATEISFRHLIINDEIGIGMEPSTQVDQWGNVQQNFAYFINTDMIFHRFTKAVNFKYGIQKKFQNGFVLDFYTGVSIRNNNTRTWSDIPEGGTLQVTNAGMGWRLGDRISNGYITPMVGLKLGFGLPNGRR